MTIKFVCKNQNRLQTSYLTKTGCKILDISGKISKENEFEGKNIQ